MLFLKVRLIACLGCTLTLVQMVVASVLEGRCFPPVPVPAVLVCVVAAWLLVRLRSPVTMEHWRLVDVDAGCCQQRVVEHRWQCAR